MEIIQEIIGTRKKQQILTSDAKKNLHKQIKKVTRRDVSEPPPQLCGIIGNLPQQHQQYEGANRHQQQEDELQITHLQNKNTGGDKPLQQSSSKHKASNGEHLAQHDSNAKKSSSRQQNAGSSTRQAASPKLVLQTSSSKKQYQNPQQLQQQPALVQKKMVQDARVRKVRSKSPPTNESGKNPVSKIKKYYENIVPAFTNRKRQHAYYNTAKQGFTYVNWDMENELYVFQTQIEQKFRKSAMNNKFVFPRVDQVYETSRQRVGVSAADRTEVSSSFLEQRKHHTAQKERAKIATSPEAKLIGTSTNNLVSKTRQRTDQQRSNLHKSQQNHHPAKQANSKVHSLEPFDAQPTSVIQQVTMNSGEFSARAPQQHQKAMNPSASASVHNHHSTKSASKVPGPSVLSLKAAVESTKKNANVSQEVCSDLLQQQSPNKRHEKNQARDKQHPSGASGQKLTQNQKQLTAMIKQVGGNATHHHQHHQQTTQSTLFSPSSTAATVVRKAKQPMLQQTSYASTIGGKGTIIASSMSQKTYGLHHQTTASSGLQINQPASLSTTPLPTSTQTHMSVHNIQSNRDQSARSQRDLQQQQGQSEPLLKKAPYMMPRKNGQQYSVNQRMPKAAPAYCTTQFNNSIVSCSNQHVQSRLTMQTSVDARDFPSNKKMLGSTSDLSASQYMSTSRLNDSHATGPQTNGGQGNGNVIKFSSEYGTYNTVQLGGGGGSDDAVNRSSDYGVHRCDSIGEQSSQNAVTAQASSLIVCPDIQIQSVDASDHMFDYLLTGKQMYGGSQNSIEMPASKLVSSRTGQSSMQAMRGVQSSIGVGTLNGMSPQIKKRNNIKGQKSSNMNKTTSINEVKKIMQKSQVGGNSSNNSLKSKGFYKTMVKPQSFVQVGTTEQSWIQQIRALRSTQNTSARLNSQTPRAITSPDQLPLQSCMQKATTSHQKTSEHKGEASQTLSDVARFASGLMHQTPSSKMKDKKTTQRQKSLNTKESLLESRFRFRSDNGGASSMVNMPTLMTPATLKMAPSKVMVMSGTETKPVKDVSPSSHHQHKNSRSRNTEGGKQTKPDNHNFKSAKWIEETHLDLTLKKENDGQEAIAGHQQKQRNGSGKNNRNAQSLSKQRKQKSELVRQADTEDNENFDMKDLDEREPCQTYPSQDFHSVGSGHQPNPKLKVPLTTRSTHSLALNNLKKPDLNLTSPGQNEESSVSNQQSSPHKLSQCNRQQTQPQVMYRNEQMKLSGPSQQPIKSLGLGGIHQHINPEYLSVDGFSLVYEQQLQKLPLPGSALHTDSGAGGPSSGTKAMSSKYQQMTQTQTLKDYFGLEDQFVIKEEKHVLNKKEKKSGQAQNTYEQQQSDLALAVAGTNITKSQRQGPRAQIKCVKKTPKAGQLNLMARDFTMQNYAIFKQGQSQKMLNLPPKPSRNAKNSTLVLGSSQGMAQMRSVQSIMLNKVKNLNQQQSMQQTVVMTPKREAFGSNNLFKGYQQQRAKADKSQASHQHATTLKGSSFKEQKSQARAYGKKGDSSTKNNVTTNASGSKVARQSLGSPSSKRFNDAQQSSTKKVNKVSSQSQENILMMSGNKVLPSAKQQFSMSVIQTMSNAQGGGSQVKNKVQKRIMQGLQDNSTSVGEKKGAEHLYMQMTNERRSKGTAALRENTQSSDFYHQNSNEML